MATDILNTDFEADDGGFTHFGTVDEWRRRGSGKLSAIISCDRGTNCWKTDLDNTYNASSSQDLLSLDLDLTGLTDTIELSWALTHTSRVPHSTMPRSKLRECRQSDQQPAGLAVAERNHGQSTEGNLAVTTQEVEGWIEYNADMSAFAGKHIELWFTWTVIPLSSWPAWRSMTSG